jgi:hypothetical protein
VGGIRHPRSVIKVSHRPSGVHQVTSCAFVAANATDPVGENRFRQVQSSLTLAAATRLMKPLTRLARLFPHSRSVVTRPIGPH